jgi:hypothetical protein
VCLRKSDGRFFHAIRQPGGAWNGFNDGSVVPNAGSNNKAVACAAVGGELQVCLVKNDGRFFHAIRRPDGSWQGFNDGSGIPNASGIESFAAGGVGSELHACLAKANDTFFHAIRSASGAWNGFNDGTPLLSEFDCVHLHVKILTQPVVPIATMVERMRQVYGDARIRVEWRSTETLNLPELDDLEAGQCLLGQTTVEQDLLFANRNNVGANDIVVYFVRSTVPPYNGCASHPAGRPGAVVTRGATEWTLAHEVGHVLGLRHVNDNNRLMTGNGTSNITNPPPDLVDGEIQTMRASGLTPRC